MASICRRPISRHSRRSRLSLISLIRNAYKPPDWIPGANFLYKINRIFENALTANLADPATAAMGNVARYLGIQNTTPNVSQLRAETKQDRADVGPVASTAADIAGYTMGPGKLLGPLGGKAAPYVGRYGAALTEGLGSGTAASIGSQVGNPNGPNWTGIDPYQVAQDAGLSAAAGVGGQAAGDTIAAVSRPIADSVRGLPGRGSEPQWNPAQPTDNWRTRALAKDPTLSNDVSLYQKTLAPNDPAQPALANFQAANAQSTDPGYGAKLVKGAAATGSAALGFHDVPDWTHTLLGFLGGGAAATGVGDAAARAVNTVDRNINVGQAADKLYPALTGTQSTTDTSPWANMIRQWAIGGSQPQ